MVIHRKTPKEDAYLCEKWSKRGCLPQRKMEHSVEELTEEDVERGSTHGAGTGYTVNPGYVDKKIHAWKWLHR
ncbi:unnamed protein product [Microthlaspi erraticum]|uniref:Uncharacterized protein n=1 Tax=Microthlaspi erraticum TaxID=1685480 RepID=A0A6D2IPN5_9BRAS|nr:unnamed protein product [Microthlaspi erraticum]